MEWHSLKEMQLAKNKFSDMICALNNKRVMASVLSIYLKALEYSSDIEMHAQK